MMCPHQKKLLCFLNEIHSYGKMPVEKQTTYNDYEKKRQFHEKLRRMAKAHLIQLHEENGTIMFINLDIAGDLLRIIYNEIERSLNGT